MAQGCPECGDRQIATHPKYGHQTFGCGYSSGHGPKSTPCEQSHAFSVGDVEVVDAKVLWKANEKLVDENIKLTEVNAVAKRCMEEAVATNATLRRCHHAAIGTLNDECDRLKKINKTLTEQSAALADANIKLVQENQLTKLDLAHADKQMASMQRRIDVQAETIEATHATKPSLLGWLFCD